MIGGLIRHTGLNGPRIEKAPAPQGLLKPTGLLRQPTPSLVVRGEAKPAQAARSPQAARTAGKFGQSVSETKLVDASLHWMSRLDVPLLLMVLEAHEAGEAHLRFLADRLKNAYGQKLSRAGGERLMLEVLEGQHAVHSNIVAPVPLGQSVNSVIESLLASPTYGPNLAGGTKLVTDVSGLRDYLLKEATPQAWWAAGKSFRRERGSHVLGDGGGDRVRLSGDLEAALLREGLIQPRTRTYCSRALPKAKRPKPTLAPVPRPTFAVVAGGQLAMFGAAPAQSLREFGHGLVPAPVAAEIERERRRLGLSQAQLAARVGIRQPQYANAMRGHDPLSSWVVARLRDALLCPAPPMALAA